MLFLSKYNKFYSQNGKLLSCVTKGDLLNIDLDGNGKKIYRVLAINGNIAKVLGMSDISNSQAFNTINKTGTFTNGTTGQLYTGSDLDIYLNTTWYNTLSTEAKNAIVSESRTQYMYQLYGTPNTPNTPTYTYQFQYGWSDSDYKNADLTDSVLIGYRNIFALDLKDIFNYFDKVCITSNELMKMWTNQTSMVNEFWWLSSAYTVDIGGIWTVFGPNGSFRGNDANLTRAARPAFNIDLSKINFTIIK